jgi:tRNA (cytidine56-2'-O)-methyltransferase
MIYLQDVEKDIPQTVKDVNASWGGAFEVVVGSSWKSVILQARAEGRAVVHLTMYGLPLQDKLTELREPRKLLVVVGGPKVPGKVYYYADFNVSVTGQPHSEIAALAIFLHEIQSGEELKRDFGKSKLRIVPAEKGKHVVKN